MINRPKLNIQLAMSRCSACNSGELIAVYVCSISVFTRDHKHALPLLCTPALDVISLCY